MESDAPVDDAPASAGVSFRITLSHQGHETVREFAQDQIIIGRPKDGMPPDLDLYPDLNVSRRHARIWHEEGSVWVEDTGSKAGTRLNDAEIRGHGRQQVPNGSLVQIGDTSLHVEFTTGAAEDMLAPTVRIEASEASRAEPPKPVAASTPGVLSLPKPAPSKPTTPSLFLPKPPGAPVASAAAPKPEPPAAPVAPVAPASSTGSPKLQIAPPLPAGPFALRPAVPPAPPRYVPPPSASGAPEAPEPEPEPDVTIATALDAGTAASALDSAGQTEMIQKLSPILDLASSGGEETRFETMLHQVVQHALDTIPGAKRGAFLLRNSVTDALLLSAYVAEGEPSVSETLARRALRERQGFIWQRGFSGDASASIASLEIQSGMYVPVLWKGQPQGVICVDNPKDDHAFNEDDLRKLLAIANYVGIVLANRSLQEELKFKSKLLDRLLMNFSPKIRQKLLEKAQSGKLRPGGEKSEVTVLFSDMRGFTTMSANMDAADVVELVNDYLPVLSAPIFRHEGTIDKFLGDAILAVFGSPDPDPKQFERAVMAGLAMQEAVRTLNAKRTARGEVTVEIGIGIHCGDVLHGFIGAAERLEFTVIGDAVNRCNRLCNGAKGGEVLISTEVYQRVFKIVQSEKTTVSTKHEGDLVAYRIKGIKGAV